MSFFAFVHSRGGLTRPVYAGEFKAKSTNDAYQKAIKSPGIKKIVGSQQTQDLVVVIHEAANQAAASERARTV